MIILPDNAAELAILAATSAPRSSRATCAIPPKPAAGSSVI